MSSTIQVRCLAVILVLGLSGTVMATAMPELPVIEWSRQTGGSGNETGLDVTVDNNGNVYVTGETWWYKVDGQNNAGGEDMFLMKYDSNGTKQWTKLLGTTSDEYGSGVSTDGSGNIYVAGATRGNLGGNANSGGADIFLTKYSPNSTRQWTKLLGTSQDDYGTSVAVDNGGNAYVTGCTSDGLGGNAFIGTRDIFLTK